MANERKTKRKIKMVDYLGGKCAVCGYNKCIQAMDFHHIEPEYKSFTLSGSHCRKWKIIEEELKKCIVLCSNCHREYHAGQISLPVGSPGLEPETNKL